MGKIIARLLTVVVVSLLTGMAFFIVIIGVAFIRDFRQPFLAEKVVLEVTCPIMARRGDGTPDMKVDCAIYGATGWVRRDFK